MKSLQALVPLLFCTTLFSNSLESVSLSGFIKFDAFYDTHPMSAAREGHYALYPTNEDDNSQLNFVLFQSRFRFKTPSIDVPFGTVSGLIEADFFGTANGYENQVRLRHSMMKISSKNTTWIIGQFWTPLFNVHVYPGTISFNTGVPFQPFARMPQIQSIIHVTPTISILGAATMQRDAFQEIGGNEKQIDSGVPGFHIHGRFNSNMMFAGGGIYTKTISVDDNITITPMVRTLYTKLSFEKLTMKLKWIQGEDLADHIMIGGYTAITNSTGGVRYESLSSTNIWADVNFAFEPVSIGLFLGQTKNLGMNSTLAQTESAIFYARGQDIQSVMRISPRIQLQWNTLRFAYEFEMTKADYKSDFNENLIPTGSTKSRINNRSLFAAYLFF